MTSFHSLTPSEKHILLNKGTETPHSHPLDHCIESGIYSCKQCDLPLYLSGNKFDAHCGWPSFDESIPGALLQKPDPDGARTEILCARCYGHLGHLFIGEGLTAKNTRHCVNGTSLRFIGAQPEKNLERAVLAGGCFWGVQALLKKLPGVRSTQVGYTGGHFIHPTYPIVSHHDTGHVEAVEILFDPSRLCYADLLKAFFEMHDFTQLKGQGPDIGPQYRSKIFIYSAEQQKAALKIIELLKHRGYPVATQVQIGSMFYPAEEAHQNYFDKHPEPSGCPIRKKIF